MEDKQLTTTELISKLTNEKYIKFLELYPKCNNRITKTAEAMGISETCVHMWVARDEAFSEAFKSLKKDLEIELEEKYVAKIESIIDGDKTPPQTQLLGSFFMLKSLNDRYRDRVTPGVQVSGDIIVQSYIPEIGTVIEGEYKDAIQEQREGPLLAQGKDEGEESQSEAK